MTQPLTDWDLYRKCNLICRAPSGQPCFTVSGRIVNGRPDGARTDLEHPHTSRKMRTRR
jgi:hypothetical protein